MDGGWIEEKERRTERTELEENNGRGTYTGEGMWGIRRPKLRERREI